MLEDYKRAKRYYGQAIRLNKNYEPAQQNMRRIYELFQFGSSKEPFNLGDRLRYVYTSQFLLSKSASRPIFPLFRALARARKNKRILTQCQTSSTSSHPSAFCPDDRFHLGVRKSLSLLFLWKTSSSASLPWA